MTLQPDKQKDLSTDVERKTGADLVSQIGEVRKELEEKLRNAGLGHERGIVEGETAKRFQQYMSVAEGKTDDLRLPSREDVTDRIRAVSELLRKKAPLWRILEFIDVDVKAASEQRAADAVKEDDARKEFANTGEWKKSAPNPGNEWRESIPEEKTDWRESIPEDGPGSNDWRTSIPPEDTSEDWRRSL
ncbi:MAG: hypothetical protein Q7R81_01190 [Candidatus Peregrinibacteria bacterium]|nr:hypothetical protein [Candidatus Peregrinibacteria bacterium]